MDSNGANIDLEKAAGMMGQPPSSPISQSTWESQVDTLNSSVVADKIVIEEDFDAESGNFTQPNQQNCSTNMKAIQVQSQRRKSRLPQFFKSITPRCFTRSTSRPFRTIIRKCGLAVTPWLNNY
jgi:hypothetical protein